MIIIVKLLFSFKYKF